MLNDDESFERYSKLLQSGSKIIAQFRKGKAALPKCSSDKGCDAAFCFRCNRRAGNESLKGLIDSDAHLKKWVHIHIAGVGKIIDPYSTSFDIAYVQERIRQFLALARDTNSTPAEISAIGAMQLDMGVDSKCTANLAVNLLVSGLSEDSLRTYADQLFYESSVFRVRTVEGSISEFIRLFDEIAWSDTDLFEGPVSVLDHAAAIHAFGKKTIFDRFIFDGFALENGRLSMTQ